MHYCFANGATGSKEGDWYDMEWYIKKQVPLHLVHLALRAQDSGDWPTSDMTENQFRDLLLNKIESVNVDRVREDVLPFIRNDQQIQIWSPTYFKDLVKHIKFM